MLPFFALEKDYDICYNKKQIIQEFFYMDSLKLSFEAVAPIFILMLLGYILKQSKIVGKTIFDGINKLIFNIFLPVLLFSNIYSTDIDKLLDIKLIMLTVFGILGIFAVGYFLVFIFTDSNDKRGVMLQGFFRSNVAFLGIPLMGYICHGKESGVFSLTIAIVVPIFNILAVICLERFRNGRLNMVKLLKGVISNPLIIGCAVGIVFLMTGLKLPTVINTAVSDVASIASPLAMVALGAGFTFKCIKSCLKELILTVMVKLIAVPLIMVSIAALLGFKGEALAAVLVIFGTPIAVSSYPMAKQMGGNEELSAQVVVVSSAACVLTLFIFIFALSRFGLI